MVKVNIFLTDLGKFAELNSIYAEYFGESKPARACVEVSRLPLDVDIPGPAIIVQTDSTTVVPPDCSVRADATGNMIITIGGKP